MKKAIALILMVITAVSLTACINQDFGLTNYQFEHVHIGDGNTGYCATVKTWVDNDLGIELKTEEFKDIYCSEGTYILFKSGEYCPFCK